MAKKKKVNKGKGGNAFRESVDYLKESRNFIWIIVAIFFGASLIAFLFSEQFSFFNVLLEQLAAQVEGLSTGELIWFIFQNNVTSAFFGMLLGVFLGVLPIINALLNGSVLGYVFSLASEQGGYGVILYLLPHGIFELPAIFIALGVGLKFGMFVFAGKGKVGKVFRERFWSSLKVFFTIVLPLLIVAAVIEGVLIGLGR